MEVLEVAALGVERFRCEFDAIQCGGASKRPSAVPLLPAIRAHRLGLASRQRQRRVVAQCRVVIEVLVAARDAQAALREQLLECVLDMRQTAEVRETRRHSREERPPPRCLSEQDNAGITGDQAPMERRFNATATTGCQGQDVRDTECWNRRLGGSG